MRGVGANLRLPVLGASVRLNKPILISFESLLEPSERCMNFALLGYCSRFRTAPLALSSWQCKEGRAATCSCVFPGEEGRARLLDFG